MTEELEQLPASVSSLIDFCIQFETVSLLGESADTKFNHLTNLLEQCIHREGEFILSVQQLRAVYTFLELTWLFQFKPFVQANLVGLSLPEEALPKSLLLTEDMVRCIERKVLGANKHLNYSIGSVGILMKYLSSLTGVILDEMFAGHMFVRNAGRFIVTALLIERMKTIESTTTPVWSGRTFL